MTDKINRDNLNEISHRGFVEIRSLAYQLQHHLSEKDYENAMSLAKRIAKCADIFELIPIHRDGDVPIIRQEVAEYEDKYKDDSVYRVSQLL